MSTPTTMNISNNFRVALNNLASEHDMAIAKSISQFIGKLNVDYEDACALWDNNYAVTTGINLETTSSTTDTQSDTSNDILTPADIPVAVAHPPKKPKKKNLYQCYIKSRRDKDGDDFDFWMFKSESTDGVCEFNIHA